jgi:formate dehydrogenase iron-sulfur subunit
VSCKQWHGLPGEKTTNRGTFQNPPDLSFTTFKVVRMTEVEIDKKLRWLFFPDQCRHCVEPPCLESAGEPAAVYKDKATGAVIYTPVTGKLDVEEIAESCPYHVPRKAPDGSLVKCDMCVDRVSNGLTPACVKTCPAGAMSFGERKEMLTLARLRLAEVRRKFPKAVLLNAEEVRVICLTAFEPTLYHEYAVASRGAVEFTRAAAMQRMIRPVANLVARLG